MMLIGIVGGSGSGKTTVATRLAQQIGPDCTIISMDNYYVDLPPGIHPHDFNFDAPTAFDFQLFERDMASLKQGKTVQMPSYSFITYRREAGITIPVEPQEVMIVEGIFVLHQQALRDLFDFSLYVETPDDERLLRRIERDMVERKRSIQSIIEQYRRFVAPSFRSFVEPQKYFANIILPGGGFNDIGLDIIYHAIIQKMKPDPSAHGD